MSVDRSMIDYGNKSE